MAEQEGQQVHVFLNAPGPEKKPNAVCMMMINSRLTERDDGTVVPAVLMCPDDARQVGMGLIEAASRMEILTEDEEDDEDEQTSAPVLRGGKPVDVHSAGGSGFGAEAAAGDHQSGREGFGDAGAGRQRAPAQRQKGQKGYMNPALWITAALALAALCVFQHDVNKGGPRHV
jgi:hypothetical protein